MCWIWIWQMALHFTRFLNLQRCGSLLGKCISSWNFVFLSTVMGSRTFLYKSFHIPKLDIGCKFLLKKLTSNFRLETERWGLCNKVMHCDKSSLCLVTNKLITINFDTFTVHQAWKPYNTHFYFHLVMVFLSS